MRAYDNRFWQDDIEFKNEVWQRYPATLAAPGAQIPRKKFTSVWVKGPEIHGFRAATRSSSGQST
jgi:hypothetical protein